MLIFDRIKLLIMKKLLFFSLVAVTMFSFSSCKKDWICKCSDGTGYTSEWELGNMRRPEASLSCDTYEAFGEDCSLEKA